MLETLKRELGVSRANWVKVREKNLASQIEWESIRDEFARRRAEVCVSRESAFFEEESSSTTTSIDEEASAAEKLGEDEMEMVARARIPVDAKIDDEAEEGPEDEVEGEIDFNLTETQVEETAPDDELLGVESVGLSYEGKRIKVANAKMKKMKIEQMGYDWNSLFRSCDA